MGKAKKVKVSKQGEKLSLDKQIEAHRYAKPSSRTKERHRKDEEEDVSRVMSPFVVLIVLRFFLC